MMANSEIKFKKIVREDPKVFECVVFAEVLIPEVRNVCGDFWTRENIKDAAYKFMMQGFGIDIEHDKVDVNGADVFVVESFIARPGDPDFIEGSWVVASKIVNPALFQQVLDGNINGYSYEALLGFSPITLETNDDGVRMGDTEPDPFDGHTHFFTVIVDDNNRPISGGTTVDMGHSHNILTHTVTENASTMDGYSHNHRYNLVTGVAGK